jgi:CDP-paratose 2-epimerase
MAAVLITGSAGLIGSEAAQFYCERGHLVLGIDNNMRREFFGEGASTRRRRDALVRDYAQYIHHDIDIRDRDAVERVFREYRTEIDLVVHAAAQPSHDWAASNPHVDFTVNANGTLTLLEATRQFSPDAAFVFASTNKVYGDRPNDLPFVEEATRWDLDREHPFYQGVDETMAIDATRHSLFGVSKVAADLMVQEYGRYFGMKTVCLRGGCLTGPHHAGAQLHGFLAYLMRATMEELPYTVYGYQAKQVRDNIHSRDYVAAIDQFYRAPRIAAVYNMGGGRGCSCSMLEAIGLCEEIAGKRLTWRYDDRPRVGDHIWWISDTSRFRHDYPEWHQEFDLRSTLEQMVARHASQWV